MTRKLVLSTALAIAFACSGGVSWAQKGNKNAGKKADEVPEAINRQFQWEEKVVGPKDKGVDHKKIAAMQERARRDEAAHKDDAPPPTKKRAEGVSAPASATLPTMDIEKAAPASASNSHKPAKRPSAAEQEQARPRDAIDNLLADEAGDKSASGGGRSGLRNVFASDDDKASGRPTHATAKKSHARGGKRH